MITNKLIFLGSKKEIITYYSALKPEESNSNARSNYKLQIKKKFSGNYSLVIDIKAKDFVAFRATTTSILNVMAIVHKTINSAK